MTGLEVTVTVENPQKDLIARSLGRSGLCDGLSPEVVERLAAETSLSTIEAGGILYEDKDLAEAVYVVAKGDVSFLLRAAPNTEFVEAARIGTGQFFGEGAVLDRLASEDRGTRPAVSSARKARIMCRERSQILQIPAAALERLLAEHPALLARNLLRHSAEKSRAGLQRMFDDVIERETQKIFAGVVRWLTRHTEDAVTSLRLNGDLLRRCEDPAARAEIVAETTATAADFGITLETLARLTGTQDPAITWAPLNLREWWDGAAPDLATRAAARGGRLEPYVEDFTLVSSAALLTATVGHLLDGLARAASPGEAIELRAGRHFGTAELHFTAQIPGLTEFTTLRLFQPFSLRDEDQDTGVSLALARRYARLLGGETTVKRRSGERLTLALTLPVQHADAHPSF